VLDPTVAFQGALPESRMNAELHAHCGRLWDAGPHGRPQLKIEMWGTQSFWGGKTWDIRQ